VRAAAALLPFEEDLPRRQGPRLYNPVLTVAENRKGVLDVDTVKGCSFGMTAYPDGGCYGECYAAKTAALYGIDFTVAVSRQFCDREHRDAIVKQMLALPATWYRVGTAGDPSHDWVHTIAVMRPLRWTEKTPVVITKHWAALTDKQIGDLKWLGAVVNTSTSGLDTDAEICHRVRQLERLRAAGVRSVCRVVTCDFGDSPWGREGRAKQDYLLSLAPVIDNPLRLRKTNPRVINGDLRTSRCPDAVGGGKLVSLHRSSAYLGTCADCPDQCGVTGQITKEREGIVVKQKALFTQKIEFVHCPSVIGSGFEEAVAKLALEDGIAHRAARKNMQIHSAIVLKIDDEFAGFMTFQNNDDAREFCLLQSVVHPDKHTDELYCEMVRKVIEQNVNGYPAIMTTNPKSKFETPKLFESMGFQTYLAMSGFCYMVHGDPADIRMKILAHITMTNVWDSVKGTWLKLKREWNRRIEEAGEKHSVPNPLYATRDGCWQGTNGFANVVTGHAHNGNASVLDPVACEVILRFFMPKVGRRVYNPFGGGVQFGFVTGANGYEYVASEIRKNQCEANNALCSEFPGVQWVQSDSARYEPDGMFDLIFTCPPYYKVEEYLDFDGKPPEGEINSMGSYEEFRAALWSGYEKAIAHLNDDCFFVVMTGARATRTVPTTAQRRRRNCFSRSAASRSTTRSSTSSRSSHGWPMRRRRFITASSRSASRRSSSPTRVTSP
jgi:hypothetical protein